MATNQPARNGAGESMAEFVQRRNREQSARGLAQAIGHDRYGNAIRANQDIDLNRPSDVLAYGATTANGEPAPTSSIDDQFGQPNFVETPPVPISHPGTLESFIPIWGAGKEALADFEEGKLISGALNLGLAAWDASGVGMARKLLAKGGAYAVKGAIGKPANEAAWDFVRREMHGNGLLKKGQEGHHWLFPQRWTWVPQPIRNHPFNVHGMERDLHRRVHTRFLGQPRLGPLERYWYGTPHWSKIATGSAAGHTASAAGAQADDQ